MSARAKTPGIDIKINSSLGMRRIKLSESKAKAFYLLLEADAGSETKLGATDAPVASRKQTQKQAGGDADTTMLRGLRSRQGMTQREVADATGIFQSHLSSMENGKRSVTAKVAKRLAKVLKCKWEKLVTKP